MKVIKLWYRNCDICDYRTDYRTGEPKLNLWWGSTSEDYYYSREASFADFRAFAEDYTETWGKYGDRLVYPAEVGHLVCVLVPIKDDAVLPDDPNHIERYDNITNLLDLDDYDITLEHDLPQIGRYYTLWEDGKILGGDDDDHMSLWRPFGQDAADDEIFDAHGHLPCWREKGWNGEIEEVTK